MKEEHDHFDTSKALPCQIKLILLVLRELVKPPKSECQVIFSCKIERTLEY